VKLFLTGMVAALVSFAAPFAAAADDVAGDFDFYVLALSWSPTFCTIDGSDEDAQCRVKRHGFIVHGLWPQYEQGYPEYCRSSVSNRVPNDISREIFDIMPSVGLIRSQWRKHGICSGLRHEPYFDLLREAFDKVVIPERFRSPLRDQRIDPYVVERAFIAANPEIPAQGIAVTCKQQHLAEVRICMTRDLEFRSCAEVNDRACRARQVSMPAIR